MQGGDIDTGGPQVMVYRSAKALTYTFAPLPLVSAALSKKFSIPLKDILFFDDDSHNIEEVCVHNL